MKRQRSGSALGGTFKPRQKTVRKFPWTDLEDRILIAAVKAGSSEKNPDGTLKIDVPWCEIATCLPNRNGKQCRERWCFNLDPCVKRGNWTAREDAILIKAQQSFGNNWIQVARFLKGRTENSVKTRFKSIVRAREREWKKEEDDLISELHQKIGCKWSVMRDFLPERTANAIKVRYRMIRKGNKVGEIPPGSSRQLWHQRYLIDEIDLNQVLSDIGLSKKYPTRRGSSKPENNPLIQADTIQIDKSVIVQNQIAAIECNPDLNTNQFNINKTTCLPSPVNGRTSTNMFGQALQRQLQEQNIPQIHPLLNQNNLPCKFVSPYDNLICPWNCNSETTNISLKQQNPPVASIITNLMQSRENLRLQTTNFLLAQTAFASQTHFNCK